MGVESSVRIHDYKDGTVDGEVAILIERGMDAVATAQKIEESFGTENMRGIWFSIGVRFAVGRAEFAQAESRYERHKGMHEAWFYWRRMYKNDSSKRTAQIIDPFARMQTEMIPGIEEEYDRKVQQIIVRLHWNPEGEKPSRD